MGILNVTPDSFSDGGLWSDPERAVAHAAVMVEEGADIIDIGGESTRPGSAGVSETEELRRVMPVIERLAASLNVPLSIDTTKSTVAARALAAGAEIVNDISGLTFDAGMATTVAAGRAGLVVMHTRGRPEVMQHDTFYRAVVDEVCSGLASSLQRAISAGIAAEQVVLDPGIGFGKDRAGNLELLRSLRELLVLGRPLLVGTSRKCFTGTTAGRSVDSRLYTTAATVALAVANGARVLRVHDVAAMRDVADMAWEIAGCLPESESSRCEGASGLPCTA
jgi:dihydropteroate synthase